MGSISKIKRTGLVAIGNAIASIEHRNLAGQIASYKREFKIARIWQMITDRVCLYLERLVSCIGLRSSLHLGTEHSVNMVYDSFKLEVK